MKYSVILLTVVVVFIDTMLYDLYQYVAVKEAITAKYREICLQNEQASLHKSRETMSRLLKPLQAKIDSEAYHSIGGFLAYQADFAAVCRDFYVTPGKGVKVYI